MNVLMYLGGLFSLLGIVFFLAGLAIRAKEKKKKAICTSKVIGTVVDIKEVHNTSLDGPDSVGYVPVVSYQVNGLDYQKSSDVYNIHCKFAKGESVRVYYDPSNPGSMFIEGDDTGKTIYTVFIAVGVLFTLVGIILLSVSLK